LGEEREYEISRQDRKIASGPIGALIEEVRFARDSPLEEGGFELSVAAERT
jgi:hypothetical protein